MKIILLLGRILYGLPFITFGMSHLTSRGMMAQAASQGVPAILVYISGVMIIVGGLSVILGFKAKWGAWLLVLFLVPATLVMHHFWDITDRRMSVDQMGNFMKNLSILGGALWISYFGSGPLSIKE